MKILLLVSSLLFCCQLQAQGYGFSESSVSTSNEGFYTSLGLFYSFDNRDRTTSTSQDSILYNLRLGYSLSNGLRFGLKYAAETGSITSSADNRDDQDDVTDYGLFVGYQYDKFFATFGYLFGGDWKFQSSGASSTFKKVTGIQLDIGMEFSVGEGFYIGPRFTYKNITYQQQQTAGVTSDLIPSLNRQYLDPFFFTTYKF